MATNEAPKTANHRIANWGVVETYRGFTTTTQIIFAVMFVVGIVLGASLSLTDVGIGFTQPTWLTQYDAEWLRSHAYIPNILAGFTGFLIGAPVAAVILATFASQREEKVALDRVNRLSQLAWYTFRDAVFEFCSQERIDGLQGANKIDEAYQLARQSIEDYMAFLNGERSPVDEEYGLSLADKAEGIRVAAEELDQYGLALRNRVGFSQAIEAEWFTVVGAWNTLDQYVKLQRLERDLAWFDPRWEADIRRWLSRPKNPLQEFADMHGFSPIGGSNISTKMSGVAGAVSQYANQALAGEATFSTSVVPAIFPLTFADDYRLHHREAFFFLVDLLTRVSYVEHANWPESASKPVKITDRKYESSPHRFIGSLNTPEGEAEFRRLWEEAAKARKEAEESAQE